MMDIHQILQLLPHRYPFLLVDRVLDIDLQAKTLRAIKNVSINEPFFAGHFPKRPVMPGVLMLEAMAQTCALLSFETEGIRLGDGQVFYFVGIDGVRFKRPVEPGDQLVLHSALDRARAGMYRFLCKSMVGDEVACEATIMCTIRNVE
ncbi:MAG: 3-hydroxyacyl-ACP dehydratase FabZ [Burkholderiaceae bacterium]|jgi:3-hydroxyacyl-[acyl-carrier-protein] dehydratase|uniref:3-hydroxyacyl-ACP dehydratase FabZ n=1 Tax=Extensimonas perlucida TaxID=2590786 RepID=UPI00119FEA1C|nr:3-hydroxyacyl-ACP dehydratase FabZ [Extensimonas perlucida]MBC7216142.1 3-hydroxyacyl-ACP dehydratase FabZ [Burkholderiaceae bacterium]